ncbi:MAG: rhodanese-related sulfurtransferase [Gammaproteobacteria bacterium]|nr:rhodanese-related sulfurtransferase [Gammaproteobacteria bacterium]
MSGNNVVVCALYHFVRLPNFEQLRVPLKKLMESNAVRGTVLLAPEGINGTIAGSRDGVDSILKWLNKDERFADLRWKESFADEMPFNRTKVKLKKEIVTMGVEDIDPNKLKGTYVKPEDWNDLISDPAVTLIDTRNEYEIAIGSFKNAINPHTTSFSDFPDYAKTNLNPKKNKKVAMFCTGGIRCEKSSAYLKSLGFKDVYHLQGGILKYLEEIEEEVSLWEGECFVFDDRVTVDHQLEKGQYDQCHACRMPITEQDKKSNAYVQGLSCPHCIDLTTNDQRIRFSEREKQVQLAKKRGESHIGADAVSAQEKNRLAKKELRDRQ